jgi:drug/metabolite transporter (DMT)-like permease
MKGVTVKSDALLLTTAVIWGFAFVAQRVGMDYVGPFTFNSIRFAIELGDLLVLIGAFFWAAHVLIIGWLSPRINPIKLAFSQYEACSILSLITASVVEDTLILSIFHAAIPILYSGLLSVGVAYTLRVIAQRDARPAHAAILLSLEAVFAAIGGWLILGEIIFARGLFGCGLMLSGMLLSQLWNLTGKTS